MEVQGHESNLQRPTLISTRCRPASTTANATDAADAATAIVQMEYTLSGPDPDQRKTKGLQDQGKKINLSLTEMAQFFLKMAQAAKAKKLGPGATIPGCNAYFLNK